MPDRKAVVKRETQETRVLVSINLDSPGEVSIETGIGFFDHMLNQIARHGRLGLKVEAAGDLAVDAHHTVEDVGLALGEALRKALGDKSGIERYGHGRLPMMEALADVCLDLCDRPFLAFDAKVKGKAGDFDAELTEEFFRSLATRAGMTAHIRLIRGGNLHHSLEAIFKAFALSLRRAVALTGAGIPSTKGVL